MYYQLLWWCWGVPVGVGVEVGSGVGDLKVFRPAKLSDLCREMSDNEWRARAINNNNYRMFETGGHVSQRVAGLLPDKSETQSHKLRVPLNPDIVKFVKLSPRFTNRAAVVE
jgi:hypothetical protein